jgi:outer membrane lipoprotein-sorting protein
MTYAKVKVAFGISAAIMLASGATTMILASEAAGDNLSPDEIFKKAQENYASLTSYSDEGKTVATMGDATTITTFTIRLARTNFYQIEWEQDSESSCSTNYTDIQAVWSSGAGNFLEKGLGAQRQESRDIALAKAAEISSGAAGTIPRTFFNMERGNQLGGSGFDERRQTDEQAGGVNCYVLSKESQGRTKTLWIGKRDFLIHQVRTVTSAEAMQAAAKWDPEIISDLHGFTSTETHTNIVVNIQFLRSDFVPSNGE